jgi:hypothetical protein
MLPKLPGDADGIHIRLVGLALRENKNGRVSMWENEAIIGKLRIDDLESYVAGGKTNKDVEVEL